MRAELDRFMELQETGHSNFQMKVCPSLPGLLGPRSSSAVVKFEETVTEEECPPSVEEVEAAPACSARL